MRPSILLRTALAVLASVPALCHATLGEPASSIADDVRTMRSASAIRSERSLYTVHEMRTDAGVIVREYSGADGTVFAVTWSGPTKPNLAQLLGRHFQRYQAAGRTPGASHRRSTLRDSDLVVQSSGHLRAFNGLAYLPQSVPPGVDIKELQ
jgi:hypothetical protein